MPYRRLLVATDFSEAARAAARLGARLAAPDAPIHLLHVLPAPGAPLISLPGAKARREDELTHRRGEVERQLVAWARASGLPAIGPVVREGVVALEVGRAAREVGADLVVAGAHGSSRIERILLGSTARPILRSTESDVLLARGTDGAPPRTILAATDFHAPARAAGERAREIADVHAASLHGVHAIDPTGADVVLGTKSVEERALQLADEYARDVLGAAGRMKIVYDRPHAAVPEAARVLDADLVVVGTHGAKPLERLLIGSVAEAVAERAPCSVLLVRGGA